MSMGAKPEVQVKPFMKSSVTRVFFSEQEHDMEIELVKTGFILQPKTNNENRITGDSDEKIFEKN